MEKLELSQLEKLQGGCNRWARRAARATDEDVKQAYLDAFDDCIWAKYQ